MGDPSRGGLGLGRVSSSRFLETAFAVGGLTAFVVWWTWPLAARLRSEVWGLVLLDFVHPDVYLNLWIVSSVARSVATAPWELPHLPAFHPARFVLGYSEHMLGVLPVTLPAYLATGNPVFTNQFLLLATFVLSAISMALLTAYWTRSLPGAVVAGALFAVARWRFRSVPQIQLLATFYAPLVLLFSSRYLQEGGWRNVTAMGVSFLGQALCSYSLAYPMYVGTALFWVVHALSLRAAPRRLLMLVAAAAVATAVLAVASFPQVIVQRLGVSDTNPAWNAAALLERAGVPPSAWIDPSSKMFPGYVCGALALAGLVLALIGAGTERWRISGRMIALSLLAFALPLVVLATGPRLGSGGGVLAWIWQTVPGLVQYRHPERFGYLVWLPLAGLAGMAVAVFEQAARARGHGWRVAVWVALVTGLAGFGSTQPRSRPSLRLTPVPPRPTVYDWIEDHAAENAPVLEIPAGIAAQRGFRYRADPEYLLWSLHHRRPLVNGYSGYAPQIYPLVLNLAAQLPDTAALDVLRQLTGLRWLIVHLAKLTPAERARWEGARDLVPAARLGEDLVFPIDSAPLDWRDRYQRPPAETTLAGTPLEPVDGLAELSLAAPDDVRAGESAFVEAAVRNAGTQVWPSLSPHPQQRVAVVWRWESAERSALAAGPRIGPASLLGWETVNPLRTMPPPVASIIPRDLSAGEAIKVSAVITSPKAPGAYDLVAEVVQGAEKRFSMKAGSTGRRAVRVLAPGIQLRG